MRTRERKRLKKVRHTEIVPNLTFQMNSKADINNLLGGRQLTAHRDQAKKRRRSGGRKSASTLAAQQKQSMGKARANKCLLRYETILAAQLFLRISEQTSPLSKYLQMGGMDILSPHRMVMSTQDALIQMARDFQAVRDAADDFVKWTREKSQGDGHGSRGCTATATNKAKESHAREASG